MRRRRRGGPDIFAGIILCKHHRQAPRFVDAINQSDKSPVVRACVGWGALERGDIFSEGLFAQ
jgi:hypothetical protein